MSSSESELARRTGDAREMGGVGETERRTASSFMLSVSSSESWSSLTNWTSGTD